MSITGRCHCGDVSFQLTWRPEPIEIPARACGCTFCSKHGAAWTACASGSLVVVEAQGARVTPYELGTKTARFHVCATCGVVAVVTSVIDGRLYAVVNVNTFEGEAAALVRRAPVQLDDESIEARLARRARTWIADVTFPGALDAPARPA